MDSKFPPVHPGEILIKEFLEPMGLSRNHLAEAIDCSEAEIEEIVEGRLAIRDDVARGLSRFFGMSEGFWMNLQARYDREMLKIQAAL